MHLKDYSKQAGDIFIKPGIVPRFKEIFLSGFSYLAYLIAAIFSMCGLIPRTHPYLKSGNFGKFGVTNILAAGAANLKFDRYHLDQIALFFIVIAGIIILGLYTVAMAVYVMVTPASAASAADAAGTMNIFATLNPEQDIAFMMLDYVFGVPGIFNSEVATSGVFPLPMHQALHAMLSMYSYTMLLIAIIIFLYFIVIVVGETANSGTPFGERFNKIWTPFRLIIALGLLLPITHGLNSGQYIALYTAKLGSGLATNAWLEFNSALTDPIGTPQDLVFNAKAPDITPLAQYMLLVKTCQQMYALESSRITDAYIIDNLSHKRAAAPVSGAGDAFTVGTPDEAFKVAADFYQGSDIIIRFGEHKDAYVGHYKGGIKPICGEITIPRTSVNTPGAEDIQKFYYQFVLSFMSDAKYGQFGTRIARLKLNKHVCMGADSDGITFGREELGHCNEMPPASFIAQTLNEKQATAVAAMEAAIENLRNDPEALKMQDDILKRGWGGAGIWYNQVAAYNGALISAAFNTPRPVSYPDVMEQVREARMKTDPNVSGNDMFNPTLQSGELVEFSDPVGFERKFAHAFYEVHKYVTKDNAIDTDSRDDPTGIFFFDLINTMFGTAGLFDMRENRDVHPMAQLAGVGKGLVDHAIQHLMISSGFAAVGGAASVLNASESTKSASNAAIGKGANMLSGAFLTLSMVGLTAGFILYYIVPFLPFIYFFFAVSRWVKALFEAMVGVPLWALAHLKLDGEGLPGDKAINGYLLLFDVLIRPIMTVFGLIAAIMLFSVEVVVFHDIFQLVTQNLTGFNTDPGMNPDDPMSIAYYRQPVDQLFFTLLYVAIVYTMATSAFKLIDAIPNNMMRWLGGQTSAFADNAEDPTEGLTRYASIGTRMMGQQIGGAMNQMSELGGGVGAAAYGQLTGQGQLVNPRSGLFTGDLLNQHGRGANQGAE